MQRPLIKARHRNVISLIVFGILVHALIMKAAFDIYFSSPIDHGMTPVKSTTNPPAKRVVFIVADGLRADSIFRKGQTVKTPHLTKIRKTRASWGIAHTRVPTESRPGHVALLAGIYEDPSAIFQSWTGNPVDFDSVINQSANAWCWGSPNIVNMFNKDELPHIHSYSYDPNIQDFGKNNTAALDLWVFEHLRDFLEEQKKCLDCFDFWENGNIFFLHLLGIDTAGHGYKPDSLEYIENIRTVDHYIPKVEQMFEKIFPDSSTAYIFTADHGMTDWGSHGAGSDHETNIPFIAWGAGIKVEEIQKDIKQIDVAPLISALIGINYPINSLGRLPHDYINTTPDNLSKMIIANVRQLMEIYNVKRNRRNANALRFVPFHGVTPEAVNAGLRYLENLTQRHLYEKLKVESGNFIKFLISGADYYHNYYQLLILIAITVGLVAWILYVATYNIHIRRKKTSQSILKFLQIFLFIPTYLNVSFILKIQALPLMYYLYVLFPIFMMQMLVRRYVYIMEAMKYVRNYGLKNTVFSFLTYVGGLRLLVQGFHDREALSTVMIFVASTVLISTSLKRNTNKQQKGTWIFCCLGLAVFPFLPVMKTTFNIVSYLIGYALWWILIRRIVVKQLAYPFYELSRVEVVDLQHIILKLTPVYTLSIELGLIAADSYLKYFSWIWAFYPIFIIPCSATHIFVRITSIFIGFIPFYLMVTTSYEVLFLAMYVFLLYSWLMIESKCFGYLSIYRISFDEEVIPDRHQTRDDYRRAFFFIALIFMGFFGTGNIASLSSFDPMWVRCFLTVFSPFKMSALILLRIMVPFIFTICVFRAINIFRKGNTLSMFCIVLMFSDLMLLELFYSITNVGSWLEIGMSLSHFIIMEAFVLMLLILYGFGYLLTTLSYTIPFNNFLYNL